MNNGTVPEMRGELQRRMLRWVMAQEAGLRFTIDDAAAAVQGNRGSVAGLLNRLSQRAEPPVVKTGAQGWYRIPGKTEDPAPRHPERKAAADSAVGQVMEVIAQMNGGTRLLRDEDGNAWKAERI